MRRLATGFRPRRRWGQNFLVNPGAANSIIEAFRPDPRDRVLEIGPGDGVLTRLLMERGADVTAVEIDPALVARLRERLSPIEGPGRLRIVEADILELDLDALLSETVGASRGPVRVIGNLPGAMSAR